MGRSNIRWKELCYLIIEDIKFEEEYAKRMYEKTHEEKYLTEYGIYACLREQIIGRKNFMTEN